jgi:hypothetical protein
MVPDKLMNNSDLIVHTLEKAGVRWVFGIPSGPVLPLIDALRKSSVEFVLTASETSAAFMATAVGYLQRCDALARAAHSDAHRSSRAVQTADQSDAGMPASECC